MSIIEYTGPSNPQEIRKYLMRRTKDEIVWEYLRQWREYGELESELRSHKAALEGLQAERDALARERDALAAHVERLTELIDQSAGGNLHPADIAPLIIRETPATSLDKLKAQWQAEAFEAMAEEQEATNAAYPRHAEAYQLWRDIPMKLRDYAYRYRRQAEALEGLQE